MKRSSKVVLGLIAIALLPVIVKLQMVIDPARKQFQPGKGVGAVVTEVGNNPVVLPSQFIAGTVIGFREVVASLLWVRSNDFFHSGQYEVLVPLMRMITWLDPHQTDVYTTGAWHLAYNFVDSGQRADHRYFAPAVKFLEEGVENNPGVWDTKFDLGFVLYYLKAEKFDEATYWITKASHDKGVPYHVFRMIAHSYERSGRLDECIRQWELCVRQADAALKKNPKDSDAVGHRDVSKRNLDGILTRRVLRANLGKHPSDIKFEAEFTRIKPRVFRISGTANLPDGARIDITLLDKDYKEPDLKTFNWEVDPNVTALVEIGIHGVMVKDGKFERVYDLSKDIKQYPFEKKEYTLTLVFNPLTAGIDVQNHTGWHGEGITDGKYLDTSVPGVRRIRKVIHLQQKDII